MKLLILLIIFIFNSIYLITATKAILKHKIKTKETIDSINFKHQIYSVCVLTELINAGISPKQAIDECLLILPKNHQKLFQKQNFHMNILTH